MTKKKCLSQAKVAYLPGARPDLYFTKFIIFSDF